MRTLADRTVLLGEVRADLVDVDMVHASSDIQELANNNVSLENVYNHPSDYYSVINSCNIYLANVDSLLRTHGQYYYEKEICAVKTFRAWCYLELAKIYKEVPFVLDPVLTAGAADDIVKNFSSTKAGMVEICTYFINDLSQYAYDKRNLDLRPSYGGSWADVGFDNYFIPVRVMLAELYLWRATFSGSQNDYINAIRMYHDYFVYPDQERAVSQNPSTWIDREFRRMADYYYDDFELEHSKGNMPYPHSLVGYSAIMPCDTVAYYGTTNDLRAIFNSQYSNNYYPSVVPSTRIREISADQIYCYYAYTSASVIDTIYGSHEKNEYENEVYMGDLRLGSVYPPAISNLYESQYNSSLNSSRYYNLKWTDGSSILTTDRRQSYIAYFRDNILYLHMAEALNRAGFPETAFAVLKYGLTEDVLSNRKIISQAEFDRLSEIKSYGSALSNLREPRYSSDDELDLQTRGSFVIWPSSVFKFIEKNESSTGGTVIIIGGTTKNQIGIHSMGCGDTEFNKYYYLDDDYAKRFQGDEYMDEFLHPEETVVYNGTYYIPDFVNRRVVISTLGIQRGMANSIPQQITADETLTLYHEMPVQSTKVQRKDRLAVAALLFNANTGVIVNAAFAKVGGNSELHADAPTAPGRLSEAARYGIDGRRLGAPSKGLNIVRLSDGSVRKVIVR